MIFTETPLKGAFIIDIEQREDERGFFARSWCRKEFLERGLEGDITQCNVSVSRRAGTLRGMHYQRPPHTEAKVVRCTRGALYDVIIDLRPDSATFLQWFGVELTDASYRLLYVPHLFAHGFLTLVADTEVTYLMSDAYAPADAAGLRWNDSRIAVAWPFKPKVISSRDAGYCDVDVDELQSLAAGVPQRCS